MDHKIDKLSMANIKHVLFNPLQVDAKCRRQAKIFQLFQIFFEIQIVIVIFWFSMKMC